MELLGYLIQGLTPFPVFNLGGSEAQWAHKVRVDIAEKQVFNQQLQWLIDLGLVVENCRHQDHKANYYEHLDLGKEGQQEQNSEESPAEPGIFEQINVSPKTGYEQTHISYYSKGSVYSD